ncbi:PHA/PHB synthase family protein [Pusillimonas sp.]|uniref:PHA/PHB synthase family protein n=1 Tax=Pusillimonas sp. TaxID=3040095 RepID=UPI0029BA2AA5|nr:alpha/beta fold hydrolase [Pusillimonas sp.]MDX3893204.1 alpha/beta fold hydrolase [Pusillimonas sp.]
MNAKGQNPLGRASSDALVHQVLAPFTHGIAGASIVGAYLDWASHVMASPDKQRDMSESLVRQMAAWWCFVHESCQCKYPEGAMPRPYDKRYADSAWGMVPFNWSAEAFLMGEQWWQDALSDVPGVSAHHEEVAKFVTRQCLDMVSPSNFIASNPEVLRITAATGGTNLMRGLLTCCQDYADLVFRRKPRGTDAFLPGKQVAITPGKVVYRNHLIELIQYDAATPLVHPEPILIVPSWIMKYYVLDLSPENSLVRFLVERGHTVFMISWLNPKSEDRDLSLRDYIEMGILSALKIVTGRQPASQVHGVGYCLGGTLLAVVAAMLQHKRMDALASMTLLASQLDFEEPGQLGLFIDESQIAYLESIMASQGYLDGQQMAGAFSLINSKDLVWSKLVHEYLMGAQTPMTDLRAWNADATRMPYKMHSEYLRKFYLHNDLAEGRLVMDGKPIALRDLRLPIFSVSTERDHVSPWRSVYKIHWLTDCESTFVLTSGGHNVGIVNPPRPLADQPYGYRVATRSQGEEYVDPDAWLQASERKEGSWWPEWQAWLAKYSSAKVDSQPVDAELAKLDEAPGRYVHAV